MHEDTMKVLVDDIVYDGPRNTIESEVNINDAFWKTIGLDLFEGVLQPLESPSYSKRCGEKKPSTVSCYFTTLKFFNSNDYGGQN
jgi:hypothetical protein